VGNTGRGGPLGKAATKRAVGRTRKVREARAINRNNGTSAVARSSKLSRYGPPVLKAREGGRRGL